MSASTHLAQAREWGLQEASGNGERLVLLSIRRGSGLGPEDKSKGLFLILLLLGPDTALPAVRWRAGSCACR